ncbi:hypothetical protein V1477_016151 [Vespula maculifrons]|uniref:Uncharacterized protein n=1 Tax=Vespula maculifrons TaxID=7453 RepID=A0ABD2BC69_VESMC
MVFTQLLEKRRSMNRLEFQTIPGQASELYRFSNPIRVHQNRPQWQYGGSPLHIYKEKHADNLCHGDKFTLVAASSGKIFQGKMAQTRASIIPEKYRSLKRSQENEPTNFFTIEDINVVQIIMKDWYIRQD